MCGRAAVIRAGMGMARMVGARRIIHDQRSAHPGAAAPAASKPSDGAGFFRDAGRVGGRAESVVDAPAPATAAADAADPSLQKQQPPQPQPQPLVKTEDEPQPPTSQHTTHTEVKSETVTAESSQPPPPKQSPTQTSAAPSRSGYVNYNVGPTSTVPVWRVQTAAEQAELLKLEHALEGQAPARIKAEVDELAADALKAESTHTQIEAVPVIQYMQWGFDNPYAGRAGASGPGRSHVFNARSETVDEKVMFRGLVHKKRCIVLVDGFYEWHTEYSPKTGDVARKQPYFFHIQNSDKKTPSINTKNGADVGESPFPPMMLAGLYDAALNDETGETTYCCVVLTCGPSTEMRKVHTRMPVILTPDDARKWVNVDNYQWDEVKQLCKPYEGLGFYKVPQTVNYSRNHGVECIEPLEEFEKRQKAAGIQRFFSPVKSKKPPNSPTPSSEQKSMHAASAVTNSDGPEGDAAGFFNTKGTPGRALAPRINPADPGQTEGATDPASSKPASDTSDVAKAAEAFVQQVKSEEKESGTASHKRTWTQTKGEPADDSMYDQDEPTMPFVDDEAEHASKKAKA